MKIYITDINSIRLDRVSELSNDRAQKTQRYKLSADKKRCIAGGLFINRFLCDNNILINEYGKPVSQNGEYFNISHSGDYVIFALSDCEVGCDIQRTDYIKTEGAAKFVFCKEEMNLLKNSYDKTDTFYTLWTKKESLLKCIGEGFHRSGKSTDVSRNIYEENGKKYYFKVFKFSDYIISACSEKNDFPSGIEFVDL